MRTRLLFCAFLGVLMLNSLTLRAQSTLQTLEEMGDVQVSKMEFLGKTPPLRDMVPMPGTHIDKRKAFKSNKPKIVENFREDRSMERLKKERIQDPIRQSTFTKNNLLEVEPIVNIDGINSGASNVVPPDPCLDVGKDFVIQMVNATVFRIYNKNGQAQTGNLNANTFWNGTGFQSAGDPIVFYDHQAERWILTEFAQIQDNTLLVAVSETSDPMGSYYIYDFQAPDFPDYPKYGVWSNSYVVTSNEGQTTFYALEREKMLNGEEDASIIRLTIGGSGLFNMLTPVDWDGDNAPPDNAPPMGLRARDNNNTLQVWSANLNWDNPNASTISNQTLQLTPFDGDGCVFAGFFTCIPQPSGDPISGFPGLLMKRVQYRNFGDYEAMVMNMLVNAGGAEVIGGLRWIEIRRYPGENWTVHQEGTFAPDDGNHRFLGGIAMDGQGNIGMAYSISGDDKFPSLRFTGRRHGDPLGEMTIPEYEFGEGLNSINNFNRYGDYSSLSVDPVDDQTFWFTGEYSRIGGNWGTKITSFVIRRDTVDMAATSFIEPVSDADLTDSETVIAEFANVGLDTQNVFQVGYILDGGDAVVEDLDTLLAPDDVYVHTFEQKADLSVYGDHEFLVFTVLDGDTNPLNDTIRQIVEHIPRFDAGVTEVEGILGFDCKDTVEVEIHFTNFGLDTLFNVNINWQMNGGDVVTIPWEGTLLTDLTQSIDTKIYGFTAGVNTINFFTTAPNGEDDQIPDNDGLSRETNVDPETDGYLFSLKFDLMPAETSWQLENESGDILFSGGPYEDELPVSILTEQFCLNPDSCFVFTIFDSNGDGIGLIDGDYSITNEAGIEVAGLMSPDFGAFEENNFCATLACTLEATASITNESEAGAGDGAIMISAENGIGGLLYSIDGGMTFQESNLFDSLSAGEYLITVVDANDCLVEVPAIVDLGTSIFEVEDLYKLEIFPNPTDGAFRLNIYGLEGVNFLKLKIIDASGRIVQHQRLQRYNDILTGALSLKAYPSGMYYIKFEHKDLTRMARIVRE